MRIPLATQPRSEYPRRRCAVVNVAIEVAGILERRYLEVGLQVPHGVPPEFHSKGVPHRENKDLLINRPNPPKSITNHRKGCKCRVTQARPHRAAPVDKNSPDFVILIIVYLIVESCQPRIRL